ncbi:MAG: DUF11 domain-containing protein, partial [Synechococcaceae cyanobacterium RL_1_2]|nr:DUF11 domain-containing protein [Synechococcaceae cyanobacterium RL_1_2]
TVNAAGAIDNSAEVTASDQFDPDSTPNNDVATEDDQDNVIITGQQADLSLTKTVDNASPALGQNIVYTVVVTNSGPNDATNVAVTDQLPAGLTYVSDDSAGAYNSGTGVWTIGTIANGNNATLNITATVTVSGNIDNIAQVTNSDQFDPDSTPNNNVPGEDDQDNQLLATANPDLLLAKRITAINGGSTTLNGDPINGFTAAPFYDRDGDGTSDDLDPLWPTPNGTYLRGAVNGGEVKPGDQIEYTIYFLSKDNQVVNAELCDLIPSDLTFVRDAYNGLTPQAPNAFPGDVGIALGLDSTTLPIAPTEYATNTNQDSATNLGTFVPAPPVYNINGPDRGYFAEQSDPLPLSCGPGVNTEGAVVVEILETLPNASGSGTPTNSYGFIRFIAEVK